tara:strand:+ start:468 stop:671 length:204 start_codon:yes stop_codon:yes gene_type:complete
MEIDISQILFFAGLVAFFAFSYYKEKKRSEIDNHVAQRIKEMQEDINLIARNPQLARRKLKKKDALL